jgi:3',5'-cyclic-nucleotide phosphodiesterase
LKGFKSSSPIRKPPAENFGKIKAQLKKTNDLDLEFVFPEQANDLSCDQQV